MNQPIKVSIIIPVYQVENYLERAVDSAIAQTLPEKEIILVDDGSDDASPQICDRYAQEYPDLIHVIHKENEGLGPVSYTHLQPIGLLPSGKNSGTVYRHPDCDQSGRLPSRPNLSIKAQRPPLSYSRHRA